MCIPHGAAPIVRSIKKQKSRPQKSIKRVSQNQFEKGDPDFIDERTSRNESKEKDSFLSSLFK